MKWLRWFLAGALAVPLFHQVVLWFFNLAGLIDRPVYAMTATRPFGVPQLISLSFWGGVWGVILGSILGRMAGGKYWITALLFGGIAPTLVAAFVVAPLKGQPLPDAKFFLGGFLINAAWGIGTALLALLMARIGPRGS